MRAEPRLLNAGRALADIAAVFLAFAAAFLAYREAIAMGWLPGRTAPPIRPYLQLCAGFAGVMVLTAWRTGLYPPVASVLNLWETRAVLKAVVEAVAYFLAAIFIFKAEGNSRIVTLSALVLVAPLILVQRRVFTSYLKARRRRGANGVRVLIVGCGEAGRLLMKKILEAPQLGYAVVGFLDAELSPGTSISCSTDQATLSVATRRILGRPDDLEDIVAAAEIDEILVDEARLTREQTQRVLDDASRLSLHVGVAPGLSRRRLVDFYMEDLAAIPVLRPHAPSRTRPYSRVKRVMDVVGAGALLLLTAPIWIVSALLIRLGSEGPVLFKHQRIGLHGRPFDIMKFRTMHANTDPYAPSPEGDRDRRITPIGRVLRSTGLDELPQLLNVLKGEMSLVGPRPEMPFIVESYSSLERMRLEVKPGITGLWQLSPDRHQQIHENLEYDLYYINNFSPLLDALVLVETVFVTAEIALQKLLRRDRSVDEGPRTTPLPARARPTNRYVLVALDQRIADTGDIRWKAGLRMALGTAEPYPVKFLATMSNEPRAQDLIRRARQEGSLSSPRIDYVPVAGPRDAQSFVDRAAVVVTDLPDIASLAERHGKRLLTVEESSSIESPSAP